MTNLRFYDFKQLYCFIFLKAIFRNNFCVLTNLDRFQDNNFRSFDKSAPALCNIFSVIALRIFVIFPILTLKHTMKLIVFRAIGGIRTTTCILVLQCILQNRHLKKWRYSGLNWALHLKKKCCVWNHFKNVWNFLDTRGNSSSLGSLNVMSVIQSHLNVTPRSSSNRTVGLFFVFDISAHRITQLTHLRHVFRNDTLLW